jgi:hypothetical protein
LQINLRLKKVGLKSKSSNLQSAIDLQSDI